MAVDESNSQILATVLSESSFKDNEVLLMPLGDLEGIGLGNDVIPTGHTLTVRVGKHLLGRVLDGLGDPLDEKTIKCRPFG